MRKIATKRTAPRSLQFLGCNFCVGEIEIVVLVVVVHIRRFVQEKNHAKAAKGCFNPAQRGSTNSWNTFSVQHFKLICPLSDADMQEEQLEQSKCQIFLAKKIGLSQTIDISFWENTVCMQFDKAIPGPAVDHDTFFFGGAEGTGVQLFMAPKMQPHALAEK